MHYCAFFRRYFVDFLKELVLFLKIWNFRLFLALIIWIFDVSQKILISQANFNKHQAYQSWMSQNSPNNPHSTKEPPNLIHKMIILSHTILCTVLEMNSSGKPKPFRFQNWKFLFCYQFRIWVVFVAFFLLVYASTINEISFVLLWKLPQMKKNKIDGRNDKGLSVRCPKKFYLQFCGYLWVWIEGNEGRTHVDIRQALNIWYFCKA